MRRRKPLPEPVRCEMCGEGIGPGIRPNPKRHADAVECFLALKRAIRDHREIIHDLVATIDAGQTRVVKATFMASGAPGEKRWSITVTDPLGDEDRMARLVAYTCAGVFGPPVTRPARAPSDTPTQPPASTTGPV